jgi:uncharacterized protein with PIN domain
MAEIRFIADVMVGKLARWLRVLGCDVAYSNTFADEEIIAIAECENRVILTRDKRLAARRTHARCILIEDGDYKEQLRQVLAAFNLTIFRTFSRCLECNTSLEHVDKESVFSEIPPFVYLTHDRFARCPNCKRVYWHGTHADEMRKRIP